MLVYYLSVVAAFAIYPQMQKGAANARLAAAAIPAIAVMVGISGSRGALGSISIILLGVIVICVKKPAFFDRAIKMIVLLGAGYFALTWWSEFQQGMEIHQSRIEGGGGLKDGMLMRTLTGLLDPFYAAVDAPFFGTGLGMGTNAASGFLYGRVVFNLGEGDWGRIVRESGPILGFAYIALRVSIVIHLARRAFEALRRDHPLPMLLFAAAWPQVLNGQFGVPSLLGFAVFSAGICLAANASAIGAATVPAPADARELQTLAAKNCRGRSIYAEQLHGEIEDPDVARFGP